MPPDPGFLLAFFPAGYASTILIEIPILAFCLSRRHSMGTRISAGVWLTAWTYPFVALLFFALLGRHRGLYLLVAETFAPLAECALFWLAHGSREERGRPSMWQDFAAIVAANLASFLIGELASPALDAIFPLPRREFAGG
ncbi:MAG: hypothetical protein AAB215_01125 [Planctomycetota bacterium]